MTWRLAKSLDTLRKQVNELAPKRGKADDGTLGDTAHSARKSDHNVNNKGVVQAMDLTHDPAGGFNSYAFAELLRVKRDFRIKYVISNGRIFSGPVGVKPWQWRPYSGSNKHDRHVHVSVEDVASLYDDPKKWDLGVAAVKPPPPPDVEPVAEPDDTKPHAAEVGEPKTGITAGAKGVVGVGALGIASQGWDALSSAPDTILQAIVAAMGKPAFWVFAVVIGVGFYIWWRRSNMKAAP